MAVLTLTEKLNPHKKGNSRLWYFLSLIIFFSFHALRLESTGGGFASSLPSYPTEWNENRLKILWEKSNRV